MECSIWYSPYTLSSKAPLNARSPQMLRHGALLRVEQAGKVGFADCHPWPELGDLPLEQQLQKLAQHENTSLTTQSVFLAGLDALFRDKQKSAFEGLHIPPSHFLIPDLFQQDKAELEKFVTDGGRTFKCKVGRDLLAERVELEKITERFAGQDVLLRLDSNCMSDEFSCHRFMKQASECLAGMIDFWEDPFPYVAEAWEKFSDTHGVFLARDQGVKLSELKAVDVLVLKPAVQAIQAQLENLQRLKKRVCITSYLDHPLGQMSAAFVAARAQKVLGKKLEVCGLLSHSAYEANEFSECLRSAGDQLLPPSGTGFGFDELLEKQDWKKLCLCQ